MYDLRQMDLMPATGTTLLEPPVQNNAPEERAAFPIETAFARLFSSRKKKRLPGKRRSRQAQALPLARNQQLYGHFHQLLETHLPAKQSARILEVGCGSGKFCRTLIQRGYQAFGVDQSHMLLQLAREIAPECVFERASAYESYQDLFFQAFDAVVFLDAVEHLHSPQRFLKSAFESLAPGGLLIVSARYQGYLMNLNRALTCRHRIEFATAQDDSSVSFTNTKPTTLRKLLLNAGLEIVESQTAGSLSRPFRSQVFVARKPA